MGAGTSSNTIMNDFSPNIPKNPAINGFRNTKPLPCAFARNGKCNKSTCKFDHTVDAPYCSKCGKAGHEPSNCAEQNRSQRSFVSSTYDEFRY